MIKFIIPVVFSIAFASCATAEVRNTPATSLAADFQEADSLMAADDFDSEAIASLRSRLHARLRQEGDDAFAEAFATTPMMKQVSVVNVMGFMNPSDYDRFPKTKYLLSAAPKI
ncbi:MAG: hypothetical protein V4726_23705 [Verrucomicrobiota bacterium]